ncbi:calcium-activated chloride channel regulator 1-like [Ruditapes philippinarum]|uniref:calcium-activated chloride channel regulator 1-like n=1 Tax=Ruditapes philippinarum TaxID=129788 RepID=UPI00295B675A|nr:calcium-activated chloride channel regulator 1-like [Ruditapes philippinarum]
MWNIKGIVSLTFIMNGVYGINLFNGKYQNVNIVIQNTVAENENLIERIKQIFTSASRQLFEASRHQVYFGQINIIIPNTWRLKPEYIEIPALSELDTYITVDNGSIKTPHTKRKRKKCGSPGRFIYLPASFLIEEGKTQFGYHENVVVREWGHLRWGLWDEYGNKKNRQFYLEDGQWKPVRCSTSITGKVGTGPECDQATSKCNIYNTRKVIDETCRFCPDESQPVSNMSSIMAFNWLDAVTTFCDNENDIKIPVHQRHNSKGWSKQNVNCNSRSSWEVMREHDDFKTATTLPSSTNTVPTFRLLHETVGYRVLVIDVSGSMALVMNKLYRASAYIIQTMIPENSWLGIVWFERIAHRKKDLTKVTSQQVRDDLVSALPQKAGGATCIYCGIDEAIDVRSFSVLFLMNIK